MLKKKKIILVFVVIAILFQTSTYYIFAKYLESKLWNINYLVANPIVVVEGEEEKLLTIDNKSTIVYEFAVKNYNDSEEINEVEMEYYLEILSDMRNYIEFKLYKGEEKLELTKDFKTITMDLKKEEKQIDTYKIEARFPQEQVINIISQIEIKVHAVQKR